MTIEIIDLEGDAFTRGRVFGAARRVQIQAYVLDWLESLHVAGIRDPQKYSAEMIRETDFLSAIRTHTFDILEEVRGIASGAEQPFDLLMAAQCMDEEWAYRRTFQKRAEIQQKCSSLAIASKTGTTWIGQNMDLGSYTDGHQILLRITSNQTEPGALVFTVGGMIGLLGVNARGLGVCVNALSQLPASKEGVPVAFVIRRLLQAGSVDEAAQVLRAVPHATGQHYLIADPDGIKSLEASPDGVVEYRAIDPLRVFHTNHPLAEENAEANKGRELANTIARLKSLTGRLMEGDTDVEKLKAALSSSDDPDHPVCRLNRGRAGATIGTNNFTTGSMISALQKDPVAIESWVSAGPPCQRGFARVRFP